MTVVACEGEDTSGGGGAGAAASTCATGVQACSTAAECPPVNGCLCEGSTVPANISRCVIGCCATTCEDACLNGVAGGGGSGASGGSGGTGGTPYTCPEGGFGPYTPTADDIEFEALHAVPSGEQILFNNWALPDSISATTPDGLTTTEIFRAYRVWSMGVANGGTELAFACGDPNQVEHYGIEVGDAIQHTWLYDFATQTVTLLADGTINDECHTFTADDSALYVCRRYDFRCDPEWYSVNENYRIGRIELGTKAFEFVTDPTASEMDLYPQPDAAESSMLFTRVTIEGSSQSRAIMQMALPTGTPTSVRADANGPVLSPDGLRYLYVDYDQNGWLYASDLDGQNEVLVAEAHATSVRYSPDGQRVAFLADNDDAACSDIVTVAADGSEAQGPAVVRDCGESGEFITDIAWIVRP